MRVVISQSMLFPWVGMLEQVRQADVFVHYDDVQFSKGSFVNRVQIKTAEGTNWMTVPLRDVHVGQRIADVRIAPAEKWVSRHLALLARSFKGAPYSDDAIALARGVYAAGHTRLGDLARASLMAQVTYFGLDAGRRFVDVQLLGIEGAGSQRVLDVVRRLGGTSYITGHGAARYLDHRLFDAAGIQVEYMDYRCLPYPQGNGAFTPYVSGLDLVAHCGRDGLRNIASQTLPWREFVHEAR
jgi:hypothetical protein